MVGKTSLLLGVLNPPLFPNFSLKILPEPVFVAHSCIVAAGAGLLSFVAVLVFLLPAVIVDN